MATLFIYRKSTLTKSQVQISLPTLWHLTLWTAAHYKLIPPLILPTNFKTAPSSPLITLNQPGCQNQLTLKNINAVFPTVSKTPANNVAVRFLYHTETNFDEGNTSLVDNELNNTIIAGQGDASLWCGFSPDDDLLIGGNSRNTFFYRMGNGNDTIPNYWNEYHFEIITGGAGDELFFSVIDSLRQIFNAIFNFLNRVTNATP